MMVGAEAKASELCDVEKQPSCILGSESQEKTKLFLGGDT